MKKFGSIISTFILVVLIFAVMVTSVPKFFGIKVLPVLGSSMEPAIHVGDLIYTVPTTPENIKPGDVISFVIDQNLTVATHRVVSKDEKARKFITKGDANESADGPVLYDNVIGVVRFTVPKAGFLIYTFTTPKGKIFGITLLAALVIIAFVLSSASKKNKPAKKDSDNP